MERPPRIAGLKLPERYVAAKFYYNDCFPATDDNRLFVRELMASLIRCGPVVSLSTGAALDDHGPCSTAEPGMSDAATIGPPSQNLHVQSAIVAHADTFVGTYGGFAYLAPFYGVPCTAYYGDPCGFSPSHLTMAQTAFASLGTPNVLDVRLADRSETSLCVP